MCVSGESEPVSVTSLPHHGSDPISVQEIIRQGGFWTPAQNFRCPCTSPSLKGTGSFCLLQWLQSCTLWRQRGPRTWEFRN